MATRGRSPGVAGSVGERPAAGRPAHAARNGSGFELFGCRGCGSACIEVALEWVGVPCAYREIEDGAVGPVAESLRALNPLLQVPTLRFPDGSVMTESAAIIVALDEAYPESGLLPRVGDPARRTALRWIAYIAANVYAAVGIADFPERWVRSASAREELDAGSRTRLEQYWQVMEAAIVPAPFLAGARISLLDVYAATVSWWRPGRKWLAGHCPRLCAVFAQVDADARVAPVWARNFRARGSSAATSQP
jgi:GST-like protein